MSDATPDPQYPAAKPDPARDAGGEVRWDVLRSEVDAKRENLEKTFSPDQAAISQVLEQRAGKYARRRSATDGHKQTVPVVLVRAGQSLVGLPASLVREVVVYSTYAPVRGAAPNLLGVINVHNGLYSLVDLNGFLKQSTPGTHEYTVAAILRHPRLHIALACTEVLQMVMLPQAQIGDDGVFPLGDEFGVLLSTSAILEPFDVQPVAEPSIL